MCTIIKTIWLSLFGFLYKCIPLDFTHFFQLYLTQLYIILFFVYVLFIFCSNV